jgi:uncharacterized DUF497 family protein
MRKYLLDTNVLSELLKPHPNENVIAHLKTHDNDIVTASLVIQEMVFGYQRLPLSKRRSELDHRFSYFEERWITIGATRKPKILVVANLFFSDEGEELIRIISARPANPMEQRKYENT